MSWLRGRYYIRSIKQDGRVIHEYVGGGELGRAVATLDTQERAESRSEAAAWQGEMRELDLLDARAAPIHELIELLARAALAAAGYHQHDRGEWRRSRESTAKENRAKSNQ